MQDVTINDNFSKLSEALFIADRHAREEVKLRSELSTKVLQKEKTDKEEKLRMLAQKAREERQSATTTSAAAPAAESSDEESESSDEEDDRNMTAEERRKLKERQQLRRERARQREKELRKASSKGGAATGRYFDTCCAHIFSVVVIVILVKRLLLELHNLHFQRMPCMINDYLIKLLVFHLDMEVLVMPIPSMISLFLIQSSLISTSPLLAVPVEIEKEVLRVLM